MTCVKFEKTLCAVTFNGELAAVFAFLLQAAHSLFVWTKIFQFFSSNNNISDKF
jgi:hypothetical protein